MALEGENQSLLRQISDLTAARDTYKAQAEQLEANIPSLTDQLNQVCMSGLLHMLPVDH